MAHIIPSDTIIQGVAAWRRGTTLVLINKVKQRPPQLVLGWVTAKEYCSRPLPADERPIGYSGVAGRYT